MALQGTVLYFELDGSAKAPVLSRKLRNFAVHGGATVLSAYAPHATHVIVTHMCQPVVAQAQQDGVHVVNEHWLHDCIVQGEPVQAVEDYKPYPGLGIPGFENFLFCCTGFMGVYREMVLHQMACTGAKVSKEMPGTTTHLLASDPRAEGPKLNAVRSRQKNNQPSAHIVTVHWLEACLRQWRHIPEAQDVDTLHGRTEHFAQQLMQAAAHLGTEGPSQAFTQAPSQAPSQWPNSSMAPAVNETQARTCTGMGPATTADVMVHGNQPIASAGTAAHTWNDRAVAHGVGAQPQAGVAATAMAHGLQPEGAGAEAGVGGAVLAPTAGNHPTNGIAHTDGVARVESLPTSLQSTQPVSNVLQSTLPQHAIAVPAGSLQTDRQYLATGIAATLPAQPQQPVLDATQLQDEQLAEQMQLPARQTIPVEQPVVVVKGEPQQDDTQTGVVLAPQEQLHAAEFDRGQMLEDQQQQQAAEAAGAAVTGPQQAATLQEFDNHWPQATHAVTAPHQPAAEQATTQEMQQGDVISIDPQAAPDQAVSTTTLQQAKGVARWAGLQPSSSSQQRCQPSQPPHEITVPVQSRVPEEQLPSSAHVRESSSQQNDTLVQQGAAPSRPGTSTQPENPALQPLASSLPELAHPNFASNLVPQEHASSPSMHGVSGTVSGIAVVQQEQEQGHGTVAHAIRVQGADALQPSPQQQQSGLGTSVQAQELHAANGPSEAQPAQAQQMLEPAATAQPPLVPPACSLPAGAGAGAAGLLPVTALVPATGSLSDESQLQRLSTTQADDIGWMLAGQLAQQLASGVAAPEPVVPAAVPAAQQPAVTMQQPLAQPAPPSGRDAPAIQVTLPSVLPHTASIVRPAAPVVDNPGHVGVSPDAGIGQQPSAVVDDDMHDTLGAGDDDDGDVSMGGPEYPIVGAGGVVGGLQGEGNQGGAVEDGEVRMEVEPEAEQRVPRGKKPTARQAGVHKRGSEAAAAAAAAESRRRAAAVTEDHQPDADAARSPSPLPQPAAGTSQPAAGPRAATSKVAEFLKRRAAPKQVAGAAAVGGGQQEPVQAGTVAAASGEEMLAEPAAQAEEHRVVEEREEGAQGREQQGAVRRGRGGAHGKAQAKARRGKGGQTATKAGPRGGGRSASRGRGARSKPDALDVESTSSVDAVEEANEEEAATRELSPEPRPVAARGRGGRGVRGASKQTQRRNSRGQDQEVDQEREEEPPEAQEESYADVQSSEEEQQEEAPVVERRASRAAQPRRGTKAAGAAVVIVTKAKGKATTGPASGQRRASSAAHSPAQPRTTNKPTPATALNLARRKDASTTPGIVQPEVPASRSRRGSLAGAEAAGLAPGRRVRASEIGGAGKSTGRKRRLSTASPEVRPQTGDATGRKRFRSAAASPAHPPEEAQPEPGASKRRKVEGNGGAARAKAGGKAGTRDRRSRTPTPTEGEDEMVEVHVAKPVRAKSKATGKAGERGRATTAGAAHAIADDGGSGLGDVGGEAEDAVRVVPTRGGGGSQTMVRSSQWRGTARRSGSTQPVKFALTCISNKDKATAQLKKLRATFVEGSSWAPGTSHLLLGSPPTHRSDKAVCGMAAGCWMLDGARFLEDSLKAGKLQPPHEYELEEGPNIEPGAPQHWRERREKTGAGAFAGLWAVILGCPPAPLDSHALKLMLTAGGARVTTVAAGAMRSLQHLVSAHPRPHMLIAPPTADPVLLETAAAAGVTCVAPMYLVQWVCSPWQSPLPSELYLGPQEQEGPFDGLAELEAKRGLRGGEESESC